MMKAHFQLQDFARAWEKIEYIYGEDPAYDSHKIKLWAARCYIELLEPENALDFIDQFIENAGVTAEALFVKGVTYSRLGNSEKADECIAELEEMSEKVPDMRAIEIKILAKALKKERDRTPKKT